MLVKNIATRRKSGADFHVHWEVVMGLVSVIQQTPSLSKIILQTFRGGKSRHTPWHPHPFPPPPKSATGSMRKHRKRHNNRTKKTRSRLTMNIGLDHNSRIWFSWAVKVGPTITGYHLSSICLDVIKIHKNVLWHNYLLIWIVTLIFVHVGW